MRTEKTKTTVTDMMAELPLHAPTEEMAKILGTSSHQGMEHGLS